MKYLKFVSLMMLFLLLALPVKVEGKGASSHRYGMGLIPEIPESARIVKSVKPITPELDFKSLKRVDNSRYLPPVQNQGEENSCVGWAVGYYLKGYQEIKEHRWDRYDPEHWMSPYFVYNLINGGFDRGAYLSDAAELITTVGVAPYKDFISSSYTSWPGKRAFFDAAKYRALGYHWVEGIDSLKQLLANGKVAVISIYVWDNFIDIQRYGNVYTVADIYGQNHGGHAVVVVGYDDNKYTSDGFGAFRVVNSWGKGWGDNGFFWLSYKAFLTKYISTGYALYLDDMWNYSPATAVAIKINHTSRGDILKNGIRIEYHNRSMRFLYFPYIYSQIKREGLEDEYQHYPFPEDYMVFDITDIAENLKFGDKVTVELNDSIPGNEGSVESVELYYLKEKSSVKYEANTQIPDNGKNVTVKVEIKRGFHTPIEIKDDLDFYELNGVFKGDGTFKNPYVIENCTIDGHGGLYGIYIEFTTSTFIIRNCTIKNVIGSPYKSGTGIYLAYVRNGIIEDNRIYNSTIGIYLRGCWNNEIRNNSIEARSYGIYVVGNYDNRVEKNTLNGRPVYYYHNLKNVKISDKDTSEITVAECSNIILERVKIDNGSGMRILRSVNVHIRDFTVDAISGVEVNGSVSIRFEDGRVKGSLLHGGIWTFASQIIHVDWVTVEYSYNGLYFAYSNNITVERAKLLNNLYNGIYALESGMSVWNSEIGINTIDGIHIISSFRTTVNGTRIFSNGRYGIFSFASWEIGIEDNKIENNTDYGVYFSHSHKCVVYENRFYFNHGSNRTFNKTHIQAYDDGNNSWNSTVGNFWEDWIRVDTNHDGVVDSPYPIDGPSHNFDFRPIAPKSTDYTTVYAVVYGMMVILFIISIIKRKKLMR